MSPRQKTALMRQHVLRTIFVVLDIIQRSAHFGMRITNFFDVARYNGGEGSSVDVHRTMELGRRRDSDSLSPVRLDYLCCARFAAPTECARQQQSRLGTAD